MKKTASKGSGLLGGKVYSLEVDGSPDIPGEGKPRRSIVSEKLVEGPVSGVKTLYENFKSGWNLSKNKPCLGRRPITNDQAGPYVWETYDQVHQKVLKFGAGLLECGFARENVVGIFSINRPEWLLADLACNAYGFVSCPIYDTLGAEAIEHIFNQTEMGVVVVSNNKFSAVLGVRPKTPNLKMVVLMDGASDEEKEKGKAVDLEVLSLDEMMKKGEGAPKEPSPLEENVPVTIMYTSGTTGLPKGALLSSKNFLATVGGVEAGGRAKAITAYSTEDVHLSYLPLAHVFERLVVVTVLGYGGSVGFFQGSPLKLLDDIAALKPTIFPSVPRLLNRVYDKILAAIDAKGGMSSSLFYKGLQSKKYGLKHGKLDHWFWDSLVFSKVKARLGGRVRAIVTGSAPISPEVLDFLRIGFCCEVHEGYGQTESCGASTMTSLRDYEAGNVGPPIPSNEIKLVDVPEMNYTSKDTPYPRGEICFRGPNVFLGYYKNEEKTKEAIDENGWLHSGDIGLWDEKGRIKIIDRKKNIFKLAQGEYIAPEKIEIAYCKSKFVAQAFVHGDSLKSFLVAVIIPDEEVLGPYCKEKGIPGSSLEEWIKDKKVHDAIFEDIIATGKSMKLLSFEQVKGIILDSTLWTVDNDLLTPSFKLKRPQAKQHYQDKLDVLINQIQEQLESKEKQQNLAEEKKAS